MLRESEKNHKVKIDTFCLSTTIEGQSIYSMAEQNAIRLFKNILETLEKEQWDETKDDEGEVIEN